MPVGEMVDAADSKSCEVCPKKSKNGGVAKWQTQQTQNLPIAISCRFDPDHRHQWAMCPFLLGTQVCVPLFYRQLPTLSHFNIRLVGALMTDVFKGLFVFLLKIFFLTDSVRKPNFRPNLHILEGG